ncbi:MAG: hypothetical protein ACOYVD_01665 [Bacillota bacterium]
MRRVRGGRNKDRGIVLNMAGMIKEDWLMYLLVFSFALLGILIGGIIGKLTGTIVALSVVVFFGLIIAGLLTAWAINRKTQSLEQLLIQNGLKEQYNAFALLIKELERNLNVEHGSMVNCEAWRQLKYDFAFFPAYIHEELSDAYERLMKLEDLDIVDYRQVILEELDLPVLISKLRDWQQKIKRQLPYVD